MPSARRNGPTEVGTGPIEVDPKAQHGEYSAQRKEGPSLTASLTSSVMKYRTENGRTYHAYRDGKYAIPNDAIENDRLDLQHALFNLTLDGRLHLAPLKKFGKCLDLGTGTGIWAIDYADEHPESEVVAIDLSPIQPTNVPQNIKFIIDDIEDDWVYRSDHFDYIHSRQMVGSLQDWDKLLQKCYKHLRPGGWVELQDACHILCDDDTLPPDSFLRRWWDTVGTAFEQLNRPIITAHNHKQRLIDAGFVDVEEVIYKWPTNPWPKDAKLKEMGFWNRENMIQGMEGMSMGAFTRALGWTAEEVRVAVSRARDDLVNPELHGYATIYIVYGRKPEDGEAS